MLDMVFLLFLVLLSFFCMWMIDARDNRIEANIYLMCVKQVGLDRCYHGSFSDPYKGLNVNG
jgi:hypothetical protein